MLSPVLRTELLELEKRSSGAAKGKKSTSPNCGQEGRIMRLRTALFRKQIVFILFTETPHQPPLSLQTKTDVAKNRDPQTQLLN